MKVDRIIGREELNQSAYSGGLVNYKRDHDIIAMTDSPLPLFSLISAQMK